MPGSHAPQRPDGPRFRLPEGVRGARVSIRPAAITAMVLVAVVVLSLVGVRVWWAQARAIPTPLPAQTWVDEGNEGSEGAGQSAETDPVPTAEPDEIPSLLIVHVAGAVHEPGVVEVPSGARVADVVQAAGGLVDEADTTRVNLARPVQDGDWIWVPTPHEETPELVGPVSEPQQDAGGGTAASNGGLVDLNIADAQQLEELPGVGPKTAQAIMAWREENGRFTAVEELLEISGIGPKTLERIAPHVRW